MHLEEFDTKSKPNLHLMDKWLFSKLHKMIESCTAEFDKYEYSKTKSETEQFFWGTFCDNYLEIVKDRIYNPDRVGIDATNAARFTLYHALLAQLKMIAPIMPHITEEIYQLYFANKEGVKSIHNQLWPEFDKTMVDKESEEVGDVVIEILSIVRKHKSSNNLSLKTTVKELKVTVNEKLISGLEKAQDDLLAATKAEKIEYLPGEFGVEVII